MDVVFAIGVFIVIGGFLIRLYRGECAKATAVAATAAELASYERQLDAANNWIRDHRDRGVLPTVICGSVPKGFDHDERVLCVVPNVDLLEPRAVRRSTRSGRSAYGGPTIRLARGLSIRLGVSGSTGTSESESFDELRQIDHGTLILTTKRLAFLGSLRTNSSSLDDLIGVKDVGNGIQVHRERKQKAETYLLTYPHSIDGLVITGSMIQLAIEMAKLAQEGALEATPPPAQVEWNEPPFHDVELVQSGPWGPRHSDARCLILELLIRQQSLDRCRDTPVIQVSGPAR